MRKKNKRCFWCKHILEQHEPKSRLKMINRTVYVHTDGCLKPAKRAKAKIRSFAIASSKLMLRYLKDIIHS